MSLLSQQNDQQIHDLHQVSVLLMPAADARALLQGWWCRVMAKWKPLTFPRCGVVQGHPDWWNILGRSLLDSWKWRKTWLTKTSIILSLLKGVIRKKTPLKGTFIATPFLCKCFVGSRRQISTLHSFCGEDGLNSFLLQKKYLPVDEWVNKCYVNKKTNTWKWPTLIKPYRTNKPNNLMHLQILEWMPSNACHIACHSRKSKTNNCDHTESHWNYKHRFILMCTCVRWICCTSSGMNKFAQYYTRFCNAE